MTYKLIQLLSSILLVDENDCKRNSMGAKIGSRGCSLFSPPPPCAKQSRGVRVKKINVLVDYYWKQNTPYQRATTPRRVRRGLGGFAAGTSRKTR